MLYFWINGLETTEEECFTQQQKIFVSVFSVSFSLAGISFSTRQSHFGFGFGVTQITDIRLWSERSVVQNLPEPCWFLSKTCYSPKVLGIPREHLD